MDLAGRPASALHAAQAAHEDYNRIIYSPDRAAAEKARDSFLRKWRKPCPSVAASLEEAGEELLTFYNFPASQHKSLRTTNAIERLREEFRRRVKTQASLPSGKAPLLVFFGLFASGQVKIRRIEGSCDLAEVIAVAA
jgi:putative transposase